MLDDPEVAVMISRKTAEAVCKIVFRDKIKPSDPSNVPPELDVLITQLNKGNHLPKKLTLHLLNIQQHGNFGSHDQGDESDELDSEFVEHCIQSLDYVCKWLQEDHLGTEYKPHPMPPAKQPKATEKLVYLEPPFTVKDLAAAINMRPFVLIKNLMDIGVFANQNQNIEGDVASKICELHGWRFEKTEKESN
jgi:hypothetical protein